MAKKKFEGVAKKKKNIQECLGIVDDLRVGITKLRRFNSLITTQVVQDSVTTVLGIEELSDLIAIQQRLNAVINSIVTDFPEAVG